MHYLTVGELAKQTGISKVTVRYYERYGLLPKASRKESGYRLYSPAMIGHIRFIKNAKAVGFTLEEIKELLMLQDHQNGTSQQVRTHVLTKLNMIKEKITALQAIAEVLEKLKKSCDGTMSLQQCPILETLRSDEK